MEFLPTLCSVAYRTSEGGGDALTYYVAQVLPKTAWKWNKLNWERSTSLAPPRSATDVGNLGKTLMNIVDSSPTSDIWVHSNTISSGGSRISPRRGRQLPGGAPTYDFAKISQKTAWKWKNLDPWGGGASLAPPLDPPLISYLIDLSPV